MMMLLSEDARYRTIVVSGTNNKQKEQQTHPPIHLSYKQPSPSSTPAATPRVAHHKKPLPSQQSASKSDACSSIFNEAPYSKAD